MAYTSVRPSRLSARVVPVRTDNDFIAANTETEHQQRCGFCNLLLLRLYGIARSLSLSVWCDMTGRHTPKNGEPLAKCPRRFPECALSNTTAGYGYGLSDGRVAIDGFAASQSRTHSRRTQTSRARSQMPASRPRLRMICHTLTHMDME